MRRSSRGQRIVFRLPPYDTPRAARCNKAKFRVHRRHAAGGVCEQRITALRKYIYRYTCIQTHPLYYSYMWGSLRLAPIIVCTPYLLHFSPETLLQSLLDLLEGFWFLNMSRCVRTPITLGKPWACRMFRNSNVSISNPKLASTRSRTWNECNIHAF